MFLHDLGHALLRRWYLVIVGLLATAAGVYGIQQYIPVTYKAEASVVLVPPETAVIEGENPYLYMGGLDQALSVLIVRMNSESIAQQILRDDPDLTYSLAKDATTTGPIVVIESEAPSGEAAIDTVDQLLKSMPPNLVAIQDALGVQKNARISVMTIVQDQESTEVTKKQMRMMIAGAGGGIAFTLLFTGWIDQMLSKLKVRRAAKRDSKKSRSAVQESSASVDLNDSKTPDFLLSGKPNTNTPDTREPAGAACAEEEKQKLSHSGEDEEKLRPISHNALIET